MVEVLLLHTFRAGVVNAIDRYKNSNSPFTKQYTYTTKPPRDDVYPNNIITEEIYNG